MWEIGFLEPNFIQWYSDYKTIEVNWRLVICKFIGKISGLCHKQELPHFHEKTKDAARGEKEECTRQFYERLFQKWINFEERPDEI